MAWSLRVGRFAGIDLKIHISFLLVIFIGAFEWAAQGVPGMAFGVMLVLLLFACVTLHEFGHSLVAKRFGIKVKQIVLLPIGGVAMMQRMPDKPGQELLVAIAGPAVNVVIAGILAGMLAISPSWQFIWPTAKTALSVNTLLNYLLLANAALVIFNMIPAFPLDGGRVLRSILAMFMPHDQATRIAGSVGQFLAMLLGVWAFAVGNLLLVIIAVFIFFGAGVETAASEATRVLSTLRVGDAYNKTAIALGIDDRVSKVVEHLLTSYQPDFAVVQGGKLLGVVTRADVLEYLGGHHYDVFVTEVLKEQVLKVDPSQSLDEVRKRMTEEQVRVAAVYRGERYLGLVSQEDIDEALLVWSFVQRQGGPTHAPIEPQVDSSANPSSSGT